MLFRFEPVSIAECSAFCSETTSSFLKWGYVGLPPKPAWGFTPNPSREHGSLHPLSASRLHKKSRSIKTIRRFHFSIRKDDLTRRTLYHQIRIICAFVYFTSASGWRPIQTPYPHRSNHSLSHSLMPSRYIHYRPAHRPCRPDRPREPHCPLHPQSRLH